MAAKSVCKIDGCDKPVKAHGWCVAHYTRWLRYGDPSINTRQLPKGICSVDDCQKDAYKRGMCNAHYIRYRRHGDPLKGGQFLEQRAPVCSVDGCDKKQLALGYCDKHYARLQRTGGLETTKTKEGEPWQYMLDHMWEDCPKWPYARNRGGYGIVNHEGGMKLTHRIVCEIVNGPPPSPSHHAAHNCGKGHEGCFGASCVEWKTPLENSADLVVHGTSPRGERNGHAKLTEQAVREIRRRTANGEIARLIAADYGVRPSTVRAISTRRRWTHVE